VLPLLAILTLPASSVPLHGQSKRPLTFDDFIAMKVVGDPQPSPDGKLVAYTVTSYSLQENRGTTAIWLAELSTGATRPLTSGAGSDRQPRWSRDGKRLAFISTREGGAQLWIMSISGGDARRLTNLPEGAANPLWLPDGSAILVVSDVRWPADQELDRIHAQFPTEARMWNELFYRHWNEFRAGRRQHLFRVDVASGEARDLTPMDHDVPAIATGGDGDVAVSPDGKEIAVAMHGDTTVADNTNVDVYLMGSQGGGLLPLTAANRGADNQPRWSPDGKWLAYLSMERPGFESDRRRLMLVGRADGRTAEATKGWTLSVGQYSWCPDSRCIVAAVEERGRINLYRIDVPSFRRSRVVAGAGVNTAVQTLPGNRLVYVHQSNTQPAEIWIDGRPMTRHNDSAVAGLDLAPLEEFGFVGALGDSVFGWLLKPPGFDARRRYPVVHVIHGGPQGAWLDNWHPRWNYQMFAARGYVVAALNFHGSTGHGQKFTDAISGNWGGHPYDDLMQSVDIVGRLGFVDSTRMAAAGASYGGYMIYWIAGHTDRFEALVAHDGVLNPVSMYGSTEELWFMEWEFEGTPYDNRALYERWAPLNFVQRWKTPMLIVHGQKDYRVDVSESYQAFTAARKMKVPARFLYFPDEDHWVTRPRNRRVWWSAVLDWIDQHLGAPPSQP
jgi:dipeptidyl aminopeptidase/acylaminoacyl peptidase